MSATGARHLKNGVYFCGRCSSHLLLLMSYNAHRSLRRAIVTRAAADLTKWLQTAGKTMLTLRVAMQVFFVRSHIRTSESSPAVTSFSSLGLNATCRTRPLRRAHRPRQCILLLRASLHLSHPQRAHEINLGERPCTVTAPYTQHKSESCLRYQGKDCLLPSNPCRATED